LKSPPDYSGGTAPDLHRLPFYALAGTQNVLIKLSTTGNSTRWLLLHSGRTPSHVKYCLHTAPEYVTVYQISKESSDWSFALAGGIPLIVGIMLILDKRRFGWKQPNWFLPIFCLRIRASLALYGGFLGDARRFPSVSGVSKRVLPTG
jgi:hypothetical protein